MNHLYGIPCCPDLPAILLAELEGRPRPLCETHDRDAIKTREADEARAKYEAEGQQLRDIIDLSNAEGAASAAARARDAWEQGVDNLTDPLLGSIVRLVQCVVSPGGSASVRSTSAATAASDTGALPGFLVLSRKSPSTPASMKRCCQRQADGFETPARRMISAVPHPSAEARIIAARQTCFCRLLRSATTAANRSRSAALTSKLIPSRMPGE